ncbi:MAG: glycosyltransferase N-terminal domain-containing protein [Bacteroidales bacterium]|nr:glycosyltransferase N-terminal domain-containing protein [Bacteroidales bacterium]
MRSVYTFSIKLYTLIIWLAAMFNTKAAKWIDGRKNVFSKMAAKNQPDQKWIWFHAASLGEFEQGRPLIEAIKQKWPQYRILLTFFSPSGFEVRKNYELADCVSYLPEDTPVNARKLIQLFDLKAIVFIKYEFWFNYMNEASRLQIPLFFVSAKFRPSQHFFSFYGGWFRRHLKAVNHFFLQDDISSKLLKSINIHQFTVTGDTRFDRVLKLAQQASKFPVVVHFKGGNPLIVVGSSWPADEKLLFPIFDKLPSNYKIIVAPHDISEKHIAEIEKKIGKISIRYTEYDYNGNHKVLIINNIGILSQLYQYADFAYVGGGFGVAIHNIQEAVTFGCPVIIGPKHKNFTEAVDLIKLGGVYEVSDAASMEKVFFKLINDESLRLKTSSVCKAYVENQTGATELIIASLTKLLS